MTPAFSNLISNAELNTNIVDFFRQRLFIKMTYHIVKNKIFHFIFQLLDKNYISMKKKKNHEMGSFIELNIIFQDHSDQYSVQFMFSALGL